MIVDMVKVFNIDVQCGVFVSEVMLKFVVFKVGIKVGDVLVFVDGKFISSFVELCVKVGIIGSGKVIKVGLLCDGKLFEVIVILENSSLILISVDILLLLLQGVLLSNGEIKGGSKGVKVENVMKGFLVVQFGLQKDDVIIVVNCV